MKQPIGTSSSEEQNCYETRDEENSMSSGNYRNNTPSIDHATQRYPYCIVWTPLPVISWFLPFVGEK